MGGKSGGGSNDEAKRARKEEENRQRLIREGTARINKIFDGGLSGTDPLTSFSDYDPNATYYTADGSRWQPQQPQQPRQTQALGVLPTGAQIGAGQGGAMMGQNPADAQARFASGLSMGMGRTDAAGTPWSEVSGPSSFGQQNPFWGGAGGGLAAPQGPSVRDQFQDAMLNGGVYRGRERSGGFDDDFFQGRRQAYLDYATPQLEQQYSDTQRDLTFALDRGGLLDSSVRGQRAGELQQLYDLNAQQLGDEALSYETQARDAVEDARASLIQQLNVTGDVQGAVNAARARSAALSQTPAFSPLSNLFSSFSEGLGQRFAHERADALARQYGAGDAANPYAGSRARVENR